MDSNLNYAYAIIEPNQFNPASNPYHQGAGENQKFARQAGLIVRVYPGSGEASNTTLTVLNSLLIAPGVTASVFKNNIIILSYSGNIGNINAAFDTTVGNLANLANSAAMNSANITNIKADPLANATLPGADPTNDPNGNLTDGTHYQIMLITQTQNKVALGSNTTPEVFANGNYTNVMQWTTGSNLTLKTYRAVGYAWTSLSTLKTAVNPAGLRTPVYNGSTALTDTYGDTIYQGDVIEQPIAANATMIVGSFNATGNYTPGALQDMIKFRPAVGNLTTISTLPNSGANFAGSVSTDPWTGQSVPNIVAGNSSAAAGIWGGLYDGRRGLTVKTVDVDMQKLRYVLDDNVGAANFTANSTAFFGNYNAANSTAYNPINNYNGVMYVDFPMAAPDASRLSNVTVGNTTYPGDRMLTSQDGWGLVLANATSQPNTFGSATPKYGVPDPTYNDPTLSANATARTPGFTVATNNAMYIAGNYNADGNISTPASPYNPAINGDNSTHPDPSCALAADSITILSGSWSNRFSTQASGAGGSDNAINNEVCAGMVAGIVLSDSVSTSNESGGAHNFPRFLENWGSATFAYRGSLVSLYVSEIGAQPWSTSYYNPPTRNWGYYNQFASGNYPPGTPSSRSYRRVNFTFLSKAQYDAAIAALPTH